MNIYEHLKEEFAFMVTDCPVHLHIVLLSDVHRQRGPDVESSSSAVGRERFGAWVGLMGSSMVPDHAPDSWSWWVLVHVVTTRCMARGYRPKKQIF